MKKIINKINRWGAQRTPFLLMVDFEMNETLALPLSDIDPREIQYNFKGNTNVKRKSTLSPEELYWAPSFVNAQQYQSSFNLVQKSLQQGNSYLTNLTFPTNVDTNWSLKTIFEQSKAPYKLFWKDKFTVFSPETFIQIKNNRIFSFPMKGTLAAHFPVQLLIDNPKERAEHATIVDLIRNDLSMVADNVQVDRYRYIEKIETHRGDLWQSSSQISGDLQKNFNASLGDILMGLLPAGSISGAPKAETLAIIKDAEPHKRGFYTGVAFLWDGYSLDSCVLIRFIEKANNKMKYWSGGGITAYSNWKEEYEELKEKVYLPITTQNNQLEECKKNHFN